MTVQVNWPPIGGPEYPIPQSGNVDWADLTNYLVALADAQGTTSQKLGVRVAVLSPVSVLSASDCVVITDLLTPGAVSVNLPAGVTGQLFCIVDGKGDAATNNITIIPNGSETIGNAANYIIDSSGSAVLLVFCEGNWSLISTFGIVDSYTANRVLISDGSGLIAASSVTTTTLGYLDATSSIQTQLDGKVDENAAITGATKTKITYDAKGLVTSGSDLAANDIPSGIDAAKISSGNVSNTEFDFLDGVTSGIQGQLDAKASTASLAAHTGASSGVHGVSGSVVGTTDTQVLTGKDYDGGTASNTSRLTVPKAATATLSGLTRKQGTLLYDTSLLKLFVDNGSSLDAVGSGSGAGTGSLNIVTNPSATDNTTGWTAATNYTVSRDTSNSPLQGVVSTCFAISTTTASSETSTSGVYAASLAMPAALRNTKTQVSIYVTVPASSLGVWRMSVYNASGTRMSLSSDSSGATTLPAGFTGQYACTFDADSSATYTISFTQTTRSSANTLYATLISIGNSAIVQGAAISEWQTYTPTGNNGFDASATYSGFWRRVGSSMEIIARGKFAGAATGTTAIGFPTGYTIDESRLVGSSGDRALIGTVQFWDDSVASTYHGSATYIIGTGGPRFYGPDGSTLWTTGTPIAAASGDIITMHVTIPISEWAGSGTLNIGAGAQEEYASSTTGTWDAAAAAGNTVYGPAGSPISGSLTASRNKVCRLQYPLQATDRLQLQYQLASSGAWVDQDQSPYPFLNWPALLFGGYISAATIGSTDVTVTFGQYATAGTTYNNSTGAGNYNSAVIAAWRLVRYKSSSPVGFGKADSSSSGLVNPRKGQYSMTVTCTAAGWSTTRAIGIYYQDQDGNHRLKFNIVGNITSKSMTSETLTVTGITFKNISGLSQACAAWNDGTVSASSGLCNPNTSNILIYAASSSSTTTRLSVSGDVELDSKPTWA